MTDTLRVALEALEARFKSGNDIPIRRAHITREEFDALRARLTPPAPGGDAVRELLTPTTMVPRTRGGEGAAWRMEAYYYSFTPTGIAAIDRILSAVACAGKAFHFTDQWNEEARPYGDHLRGETPVLWIENAADDAAALIRKLAATPAPAVGREADEPMAKAHPLYALTERVPLSRSRRHFTFIQYGSIAVHCVPRSEGSPGGYSHGRTICADRVKGDFDGYVLVSPEWLTQALAALTPPAEAREPVTDAMVEAGLEAAREASDARLPRYSVVRAILTAALAQPRDTPRDSGDAA